jgi:hypothetical protein
MENWGTIESGASMRGGNGSLTTVLVFGNKWWGMLISRRGLQGSSVVWVNGTYEQIHLPAELEKSCISVPGITIHRVTV